MHAVQAEKREQLIRDGYCVFERVVDAATIAALNERQKINFTLWQRFL